MKLLITGWIVAFFALNAFAYANLDGTYSCEAGARVVKGSCQLANGKTYLGKFQPSIDPSKINLYVWSFNYNEDVLGTVCTKISNATDGIDQAQCARMVRRARRGDWGPDDMKSPTP